VRERIARLRQLGFRIAIDDIGAGYSGLNSFAMIQPDVVKLDITLVRGVDEDPVKRKLVRVLGDLCQDLGILVVAEGVETPSERDTLVSLGCDLLQGYLFARPGAPFPEPTF
jgi:EAL domain-containing protein (putative c-di-GMP-specific phosphodiesterase class I)